MPRQTVVRPTGLNLQANPYGDLPPGSMRQAFNITFKKPHVISPRTQFTHFTDGSNDPIVKLWSSPVTSPFLYVASSDGTNDQLRTKETDGVGSHLKSLEVTRDGDPEVHWAAGKLQFSWTRDRTIFTERSQPLVDDNGTNAKVREAGLPPPSAPFTGAVTNPDGWLQANNFTKYIAIFRRVLDDGGVPYSLSGATSSQALAQTFASVADIEITVGWDTLFDPIVAGMQIELYRVAQQDDADLLGDRFRLAVTYELTNTDISNGFVTILDQTADEQLGADLYTNDSGSGPVSTNWMPPRAKDVITFKDVTFYAAELGPPVIEIQVKGLLSTNFSSPDDKGIGFRTFVGNSSIGSANITNVPDVTGIVPGQTVSSSAMFGVAAPQVLSVSGAGPFTVTVTGALATANTVAAVFGTQDVLIVDGSRLPIASPDFLAAVFQLANRRGSGLDTSVKLLTNTLTPAAGGAVEGSRFTLGKPNPATHDTNITLQATNGQNYNPPLPEPSDPALEIMPTVLGSHLAFSKAQLPEAVPPDQVLPVGDKNLLRVFKVQETLLAATLDGLFRVDGSGTDWSIHQVNPDTYLLGSEALDTDDNQAYAWTDKGFVSISDAGGVVSLSEGVLDDLLRGEWQFFDAPGSGGSISEPPANSLPFSWGAQVAVDKFRKEVWFILTDTFNTGLRHAFVWNQVAETFVKYNAKNLLSVGYVPWRRGVMAHDLTEDEIVVHASGEGSETSSWELNPIFSEDAGYQKQWLEITLMFEVLSQPAEFLVSINGEAYPDTYTVPASSVPFEHVIAPTLNGVCGRAISLGLTVTRVSDDVPPPYYEISGISHRYRIASETLR